MRSDRWKRLIQIVCTFSWTYQFLVCENGSRVQMYIACRKGILKMHLIFPLTDRYVLWFCFLFPKANPKKEVMYFQSSRRRGEDGITIVIDFLLTNARLVLGVGGAALLGIATLAVKRVSFKLFVPQWYIWPWLSIVHTLMYLKPEKIIRLIFKSSNSTLSPRKMLLIFMVVKWNSNLLLPLPGRKSV